LKTGVSPGPNTEDSGSGIGVFPFLYGINAVNNGGSLKNPPKSNKNLHIKILDIFYILHYFLPFACLCGAY